MASRPAPRAAAALAFGAGGFFLLHYGQFDVGVVQPQIQEEMHLTHDQALWVVNAFMLGLAVLVPHGGRLAEIIGSRRTILGGLSAIAIGAAGATLAGGFGLLVASLALQGAGAGLAIAPTVGIVIAAWPPELRGLAVGWYVGVAVVALPIVPVISGVLVQGGDWRLTFWLYLVLTACVFAVGAMGLPSHAPPKGQRPDVLGSVLALTGLGLVLTGGIEAATWGWSSRATVAVLAAGVAILPVFALVELATEQPLVDLRLLRRRVLAGAAAGLFLVQLGISGVAVFVPIYLLTVVRLDPVMTGLAMLPAMILAPALSPIAGGLVDGHGIRRVAIAGALPAAAGCAWLAAFVPDQEYAVLVPGLLLFGIGMPVALIAMTAAGAAAGPPAERGESAGILNTSRWIGATVGTVSFGALLDAVREHDLDTALAGRMLTHQQSAALDRLVLSDEDATDAVVRGIGGDLVRAVADGFAAGYAAGLWLCAGAFAAVAVIAAIAFRPRRAASAAPRDREDLASLPQGCPNSAGLQLGDS